jgi:hypothetical protein
VFICWTLIKLSYLEVSLIDLWKGGILPKLSTQFDHATPTWQLKKSDMANKWQLGIVFMTIKTS